MTSYKMNQLSGIHQVSRRIQLNFLDVLSATKFVGLIQRTSVTEMVVLVRKEGKSFLLFFLLLKHQTLLCLYILRMMLSSQLDLMIGSTLPLATESTRCLLRMLKAV